MTQIRVGLLQPTHLAYKVHHQFLELVQPRTVITLCLVKMIQRECGARKRAPAEAALVELELSNGAQ